MVRTTGAEVRNEADVALARSGMYRALAQAFDYPTRDGVGRLRREDLPLAAAVSRRIGLEAGVSRVIEAFRGRSFRAVEAAYRDVFSQVNSVDCPLHETDYTSSDIFRKSQAMADVSGFYRAFGTEGSAEEPARPDHVSVELEFMHLVTYKEAWARAREEDEGLRVCLAAQRSFLEDHLARWFPDLLRRAAALGSGTPYAPVTALARRFFAAELERFDIEPGVPAPSEAESGSEPEPAALCEEDA